MTNTPLSLPPKPDSVRAARSFVKKALLATPAKNRWDDASLLVSELVANAVLHAKTPVEVSVVNAPTAVRVEVRDHSPRLPHKLGGHGANMAGRGLYIVEGLADRWGTRSHGDGKTVWFELAYDPR